MLTTTLGPSPPGWNNGALNVSSVIIVITDSEDSDESKSDGDHSYDKDKDGNISTSDDEARETQKRKVPYKYGMRWLL